MLRVLEIARPLKIKSVFFFFLWLIALALFPNLFLNLEFKRAKLRCYAIIS